VNIPVENIEIPDPSPYVDETKIQELADSIREQGLSHPIIVRPANSSGKWILVSGEKRLLAFKRLGLAEIKAEARDLDAHKGRELRIHENLKRFNLPWFEEVTLIEELHRLRQSEHGIASSGRPKKNEEKTGWSLRDTAEELGMGIGVISEDLTLARALKANPNLAKTEDKKTALRLARIAVQRYESELVAGLPVQFDVNTVYLGDSSNVLKQFPPNSIDHCITDPPWIKFFDPSLRLDERTLPVFRELYRVLKHGSFLYVFCGLDDYHYYAGTDMPNPKAPGETIHTPGELEKIGFTVSATPVIWQKLNSLSRRGVRPWEYERDFEFIVVAVKGSPALTSGTLFSGIKKFAIVHNMHAIHPNEKPVELIEDILNDCSYEGNIIVDPFGGSGVLGDACKKKSRKYIICERDKKFYEGICKRLGQEL
jgi:DNA modification methylase